MAKSKKEKAMTLIETAISFRDAAVIGTEAGNFSKDAVDLLNTEIETAQKFIEDESTDDGQLDTLLTSLNGALKVFQASEIPPSTDEPQVNTRIVTLKGSESERKGVHSLHLGKQIITFIDGKAELTDAIALELENAGYIE
ncbi:hypothetical protein BVG16_13485 [Paenibacillus selenitireducens]|uniref:Uncharacterized protein n=1 Tax=Paenibacillus selenitireducens TaxID=1324314 RepID=A0A1T2XCG6_9BACL|nr:hypothetical protein [Paenibacillus selenitireducens]OPA77462.1 hypothetical protein BVG16_13485 [Paenibacillus selenitireducens]